MEKLVYLPLEGPVSNAAAWLRQNQNIPEWVCLAQDFEKYFKCRIYVEETKECERLYVEFKEKDAIIFLLRWS